MKIRLLSNSLVAAMVIMAVPLTVQAYGVHRHMQVNPVTTAVFEVVSRGAAKGAEYWCAVGDYAQRGLGVSWQTPIYIARGLGRSETTGKSSAVQFTLDPVAAGISAVPASLSLNDMIVGESMTVREAYNYCQMPSGRT